MLIVKTSVRKMKNKHNKLAGSKIERSDDRIDTTAEVFTPLEMCIKMVNEIPEDILKDSKSTFLDPAAGNGNFLITLLNRLREYHTEKYIEENMLYGVELMEDKHQEMCNRLGILIDHPHYVCHDALTYDYSFGESVGVEAFFT